MEKKQSTIIDFEEGVPRTVTLRTAPSSAKGKDYVSKAGKAYMKYTYFTQGGEVFFAFSSLHDALQKFSANDTLAITKITPSGAKFSTYKIEAANGTATPVTNDIIDLLKRIYNAVVMLNQRVDTFAKMNGVTLPPIKAEETSEKIPAVPERETSTDLGF